MISIDAMSGTLYLKSDAALCVLILSINLISFYSGKSLKYLIKIYILGLVAVLLTHSKAMQGLYLCYPIFLFMEYLRDNKTINISFYVLLIPICLVFLFFFSVDIVDLYDQVLFWIINGYLKIRPGGDAERLAGLGYILYHNYNLFGFKLLSYYNPITKDWMFNAGFSTAYSLLFDTGLVYLIIYYVSLFVFFIRISLFNPLTWFLFVLFFVASLFNLVFTDVLVNISIFLSLFLMMNYYKNKVIDNDS